ncbi:MAG: hypothetical protein C4567_17645 [Deltaproteobacteria bacterium]|nr:MAG: hypothetical protein C4567_17645 [Deltaproteobacteria bacterium]
MTEEKPPESWERPAESVEKPLELLEKPGVSLEKQPELRERPKEVVYATRFMIASLVLAVIAFPLRGAELKPQLWFIGIFAIVLTIIFTLFLLFMILGGRNWARLLYVTLFFIGLPFSLPTFVITFSKNPVAALATLIQLSLQTMAVVLLLQKPVREWFRFVKLRKLMGYQTP